MSTPAPELDTERILNQYTDPAGDTPPVQDVPPRESWSNRRASKSTTNKVAPKPKEPASKPGEFVEPLSDLYGMIALGVSVFEARAGNDDHNCAQTIAENSDKIAQAWDDLARKNDSVRRTLRKMVQGGAWAGVIGAHVPIALAIASNHMPGAIPERAQAPFGDEAPAPEPTPTNPPRAAAKKTTTRKRAASKVARSTNERRSAANA